MLPGLKNKEAAAKNEIMRKKGSIHSLKTKQEYSVIWQECGKNSDCANRFFVPGYTGYLPFFLCGEDLTRFQNKMPVDLREEQLLKGILFGLYEFDESPKPWHRPEDKSTFLHLLDALGRGFNCESPEKMILDAASNVRETIGNFPSSIILKVATKLIASSSRIKSDLVCDLWELAVTNNVKFLSEIITFFEQINFEAILPEAREAVAYFGLSAVRILKLNEKIPVYLEKYVYPYVNKRILKDKVKYMLECQNDLEPKDLTF